MDGHDCRTAGQIRVEGDTVRCEGCGRCGRIVYDEAGEPTVIDD